MKRLSRTILATLCVATGCSWAGAAASQVLTADRAVKIALERSTQAVNAEAAVLEARSSLLRSYAGILPRVSGSYTRGGDRTTDQTGLTFQIDPTTGMPTFTTFTVSDEGYSTTPRISGSWTVLSLSALSNWSAGRTGVQAARMRRDATRQDLALGVRRQFYEVVRAIQLAQVAEEALRLARDDERRVNALFEVGSVSKSDVLKARVRTAQGELDSLTARQSVINQRIALASLIGVEETGMGDVDTTLSTETRSYDAASVLAEAERNRPDLRAAQAEWRAARASSRAAHFSRLPYLTLSGTADFNRKSTSILRGPSETQRFVSGQIALNLDVFDLLNDGDVASARAREIRAHDGYESLRRNLAGEVRQALFAHREALERNNVAERAVESATENLKLTQQKYNVGSATILELIDAQVQLQRAKSDRVSALAAIRVAEAQVDRVRGRGE